MSDEGLSSDLQVGSSGLPVEVEERITTEVLRSSGDRVLACLHTARWLLSNPASGDGDAGNLRLAESAAYNLREALGSVLAGRDPAEGGLQAVRDAWARFRSEEGSDAEVEARGELYDVLDRISGDVERSGLRARQLLAYLRTKAGAEPLRGRLDPVEEYDELWRAVNRALHGDCPLLLAVDLLDRTSNWFVRMFTAPESQVLAVRELAASSWRGPEQLEAFKRIIAGPHHVRLFFDRLLDPTWLTALLDADLVPLPTDDGLWPVAAITNGLGRTHSDAVGEMLSRIAVMTGQMTPVPVNADFELLRVATHLGQPGHQVVEEVMRRHGHLSGVQSLGIRVALEADPRAPAVVRVARAVIGDDRRLTRQWGVRELLDHLESGMTEENRRERVRFLAGKTRVLAAQPLARCTVDIASLRAGVDQENEAVIVLAHHLVGLVRRCQEQGVPTADIQRWIGLVEGPIGERITCQVLADASDVPDEDKIAHIVGRLGSSTATGDDRDLVAAILASDPDPDRLAVWSDTLGAPSPAPDPALPGVYPDDWARVWRWSAILLVSVLAAWQDQIAAVSSTHGDPNTDLDQRSERFIVTSVSSPYSVDELSALSPVEAAMLVASWRPAEEVLFRPVGARELARALGEVVAANLPAWTENPQEVLALLKEPVYVLQYLRALTESAAQLGDRASAVLGGLQMNRDERGAPTALGPDDGYSYEPTWDPVDVAEIELIKAIADTGGDLHDQVAGAWQQVLVAARDYPKTDDGDLLNIMGDYDALHSAINRPWSKALDAAVSLARWEGHRLGSIRLEFAALLDEVIEIDYSAGLEFRAILANRRVTLEGLVPEWLDDHADDLFRRDPLGPATFEQTLKWSRPSAWLLDRFAPEIYAAALRGADNALSHVLVAMLNHHAGYGITDILRQLQGDVVVLRAAAEEVPGLLQSAEPGAPGLIVGVQFWRALLDAQRQFVPAAVLEGVGRWSFVDGLDAVEWLTCIHRTLQLTNGRIDYPIEVADRVGTINNDDVVVQDSMLEVFTMLLGIGERWEQSRVADLAVAAVLRTAHRRGTPAHERLRTRLLELGRHELAIDPGTESPT